MGPVQKHIHGQPSAQRIDNRSTDSVKAPGVGVVLIVKLASGMEHGEDDLHPRDAHRRMGIHGHAAAIVKDTGGSVLMEGYLHFGGEAVGGLVDGVIHDLPEQMMQPPGRSCSDIHAGAHPDGFQPFQNLNVPGAIGLRCQSIHSLRTEPAHKINPYYYTIKCG